MGETPTELQQSRRAWMSLMARAPSGRLTELAEAADLDIPSDWLRRPETGAVMVRGRAGGTGGPFNLGEMTVTRCSVALADGTVGHGYVQGRSASDCTWAARIDAGLQGAGAAALRAAILDPLASEEAARRSQRARKAAATKVDFFTMVRGEDQ